MLLSDLHDNPRLMAEFFGWEFKEEEVRSPYHTWKVTQTLTAAEVVARNYRRFLDNEAAAFAKAHHKCSDAHSTHKQYVGKCLSALGIKGGTVEARRQRAIEQFPETYSAPAPAEPTPSRISWNLARAS